MKRFIPDWTALDESRFIRVLDSEKLSGYRKALPLRKRWGQIDVGIIKGVLNI